MSKRIVLAGGGTGGHLFPLITIAKYLRKNSEKIDFLFLGPDGKLEKELMDKNKINRKKILSGKLRRYFSFKYLIDFLKFPIGFFQSLWFLLRYMPDVVFSKGGYASVPVVLAAKIYRIPVVIHESDAVPGVANKFLGSIANRIVINFERARIHFPESKTALLGIPVKESALGGNKDEGRSFLSMEKEVKPVVLFLGGSLGAQKINEVIVNSIDSLIKEFQVVHQTGEKHYNFISKEVERKGYKIEHSDYYPIAFIGDELKDLLTLADIVVSRAGATNIAEIAANKKPVVLVPITDSANNHQRINAYELAKKKAAVVLEEKNFSKNLLLFNLKEINTKEDFRDKLKKNIKQFYYPNATQKISEEILSLIN